MTESLGKTLPAWTGLVRTEDKTLDCKLHCFVSLVASAVSSASSHVTLSDKYPVGTGIRVTRVP